MIPLGDLLGDLSVTYISPVLGIIANSKRADRLVFHVTIVIEEDDIEMNIRKIIIRYWECETFVIDWTLGRSLDRTTFLHDPLAFVEHVDFEIRI